ncbi:DEAD/DEAH box helicase family protein, partial [Campylobacter upsaliensis]|nr:DEAD/DEAH box helicase family protein [Campylobacter upsaliensis]
MSEKKLSEELKGALKYVSVEIPSYIVDNLSKELREYQKEALRCYLLQRQNPNTNHLMFNMATGSGKTLIMAALMLDCYKRGYREFVFFVNSTSILEKTKENFANAYSSKYLFKEKINIDSKNVEINLINNLSESKEGCINIYFTTIQALHNLFTN